MPKTWLHALQSYRYPVDLTTYPRATEHPGFFNLVIAGDRDSTAAFEERFCALAPNNTAAFLEVVYWKLYSQGGRAKYHTSRLADGLRKRGVAPVDLWSATNSLANHLCKENLRRFRRVLGISSPVLAVALTFPAFACPDRVPMVDLNVARWVNRSYGEHSAHRDAKLRPFPLRGTALGDLDFDSYLAWVSWCQEVALLLGQDTSRRWRARDVEMAVFAASRSGLVLHPLHRGGAS